MNRACVAVVRKASAANAPHNMATSSFEKLFVVTDESAIDRIENDIVNSVGTVRYNPVDVKSAKEKKARLIEFLSKPVSSNSG